MALECGIVGLPNVGKSTLFNAVTMAEKAAAANYPFCTIDPNVGTVPVPDERLDKIAAVVKPEKVIATTVSFVDIAGLVKGASKGEGLGNQFLGHIKNCNAICHVVRCFEDDNIIHVNNTVDSVRDVEVIETELMLADLATVEKKYDRTMKLTKTGDADAKAQAEVLGAVKTALEKGQPVRAFIKEAGYDADKLLALEDCHLITQKPLMYVANIQEKDAGKEDQNPHVQKLKKLAETQGAEVITISAQVESELISLAENERSEFLSSLGFKEPGLNKLIRAAYKLLGLRTYFTAGVKEVRAWTFHAGWKAPQCAGVIHTDFERGFICAETYHFDDLMRLGSEAKIKEAGLMRTEGKAYEVKDGDLLNFRFNV
jgi:GTP-binding protein YchF